MTGLTLLFAAGLQAEDRQATQAALDRACELSRQLHLLQERARLIRSCQAKPGRSRQDCQAEYANYGERAGSRPPLHYDLPICKRAFDYQRSYRSAD